MDNGTKSCEDEHCELVCFASSFKGFAEACKMERVAFIVVKGTDNLEMSIEMAFPLSEHLDVGHAG